MGDIVVSRWDRFLISIAPKWGVSRIRARATANAALRHFDAAGTGRRTSGWSNKRTDANSANARSISKLRDLSRDLRRNNGWARRGIQVISANAVGWGIEAKAMAESEQLAADAAKVWKAWARSTSCDYDGRLPFSGIQRLVMDTVVESGEALIMRERGGSADGLPVPVRVRVLEPDYLDDYKRGKAEGDGRIRGGIEYDGKGRRVAYWIHHIHPGASFGGSMSSTASSSYRVPAEDIIHVYQVERPGQSRGVPWLASTIAKLNEFDEYDDARLMQAKIAACFGAFVTDVDGAGSPLGEQDPQDERLETLEPGHIEYLSPGKQITFPTPPSVSDHASFSETQLRRIAASLGVTYEDLTGDYSRVNFSSARMARLAHWANVSEWRWNMLIPQLCDGVWAWVMESAAGLNEWPSVPTAEWSPPPMPMLSPEKEGLAYARLVRSGVMTLYQAIRERGEDPTTHLEEFAAGNKRLDELGIILDSDARKTAAAGYYQPDVSL